MFTFKSHLWRKLQREWYCSAKPFYLLQEIKVKEIKVSLGEFKSRSFEHKTEGQVYVPTQSKILAISLRLTRAIVKTHYSFTSSLKS